MGGASGKRSAASTARRTRSPPGRVSFSLTSSMLRLRSIRCCQELLRALVSALELHAPLSEEMAI